ncbi:MAG: FAD-binding oxidoreductase, partial [Arenicellales bacterium]
MSAPLNNLFVAELLRALPAHAVLLSAEERRPYECDGLSGYRALPGVVLLPDQLSQVQKILSLCQ